ncbi:hypothetical protein DUI87_24999 [Hirundo rustica rustica]|uniref:Uncharacterized protein n=1 Tax=Hirundo rustica rustica TaxID=333673 RepID=A0A3M0JEL8_HIRRU|nr:hypothetical protein DUI87_24999 [Hirundo rustica rustica]
MARAKLGMDVVGSIVSNQPKLFMEPCIQREGDKRMDPAQWCQAVEKCQWAETDTQKVPPGHGEELLYCAGDHAQEWIAKRICGVSHTGEYPELSGHNPFP